MPKRTIFFDDNQDTTLGGRVFQARKAADMTIAGGQSARCSQSHIFGLGS